MIEATLCFILDGSPPARILLGRKKRGFGKNKLNGFGGKVQPGETPLSTIIREVREESGLTVSAADLRPMGTIDFYFPSRPEYDHHVHVFLAPTWRGKPCETEEMAPAWFPIDAIPHGRMWADDAHWLPVVLSGTRIQAQFTFASDNESIVSSSIREL